MLIQVAATDEQWEALQKKSSSAELLRVADSSYFVVDELTDGFFNLIDCKLNKEILNTNKPYIINAVAVTLKELGAPVSVLRINGWPGFTERDSWEIAGNMSSQAADIFKILNIKITTSADEPGLITGRIITMIINEAYMTVEENVSSREEIDVAMKLGTNYPFGPFEWATAIGVENIYLLLKKLSETDSRYRPANLLAAEINKS